MSYIQKFNNRLKYGNIRTEYRGGMFMSKKEARKGQELDIMKNGGAIKDWDKQYKLSIDVNGQHITNYFVDFIIYHNDGDIEYLEIKSPITCTDTWKIKWKLAQAIYADETHHFTVEM